MGKLFQGGCVALSQLLNIVSLIVVSAILSRFLVKTDYATFAQTLLVYETVSPLLGLGLPAALYYFLPGNISRAKGILWENLTILTFVGFLFCLFLRSSGSAAIADGFGNKELRQALYEFSLYPLFALPTSATIGCLVCCERHKLVVLYSLVGAVFQVVVVLVTVNSLDGGVLEAINALVVFSFFNMLVGASLMFFAVSSTRFEYRIAGSLAQLKYGIPLGLGIMVGKLHRNLDKILVSKFATKEEFAIYVNGAVELPVVAVAVGAATAVLLPEMRRSGGSASNLGSSFELWKNTCGGLSMVMILTLGFFMVTAADLMVVVFSREFSESAMIFRIYLTLLPFRAILFGVIFQGAGRTDLLLKRTVILLVANLLLSLLFILLLPYQWVSLATVLVIYLVSGGYSIYYCKKLMSVKVADLFPWRIILRSSIAALVGAMMLIIFRKVFYIDNDLQRISVSGLLYSIAVFIGARALGILPLGLLSDITGKYKA